MSLDVFYNKAKDPNFIGVRRSFIVSKSKVTKINSTTAFIGNDEVPISRNINLVL